MRLEGKEEVKMWEKFMKCSGVSSCVSTKLSRKIKKKRIIRTQVISLRKRLRYKLNGHSDIWDNFWQLKGLSTWWKMLFISAKKLFLFWRYLNFCSDSIRHVGKQLDKNANVNFKMYGVTSWETSNYNIYITQYLKK